MKSWINQRRLSFKYAINGIRLMTKQTNFRIHIIVFSLVVALATYLQISSNDWVLILLVSGLVFVAEGINTAIESLTDLVTMEKNKQAGNVKDIAAGAVLIAAIISITTGLIIFSKYIL